MALDRQTLRAIQKYGPSVSAVARRYGLSGSALLAKLVTGESGGNPNAVSSAGARGLAQFTAGSRQVAIQKYGIDPWASPDQALHAASLHLRGKINGQQGLGGYNPGDPSYAKYILGQKVGNVGGRVIGGSQTNASGNTDVVTQSGTGFSPGQVTALQQALQSAKPQVQITAPQAPAFSAAVPLPKGYQAPASSGVQASSQASSLTDQLASLAQGQSLPQIKTTITPGSSGSGSAPASVKGIAKFDGKPVAAWIAGELKYARAHGWKGTVTSGYRSFADQKRIYDSGVRPAAKPGTSNHEFANWPHGAVDVTDPQQLAKILAQKGSPLKWAGAKDKVHFSHPSSNGSY